MTQLFEVTDTRTYLIAAADEAEAERLVKEVGGIFDCVRVVSARPRRAAQETSADDTPPHLMAQGYRSGKIEDVCHECGGDRISRQSEAAFAAKEPCASCAQETGTAMAGGEGADETTAATEPVSRPASPPFAGITSGVNYEALAEATNPPEWPGPFGLCADGQPHVPQPGSDPLMCGRCKNDLG